MAACEEGKEAAANAKGQDAADAFNAALGGEGVGAVEEDGADESDEAAEKDVTCNTSSSNASAKAASSSTSAATASNADHDEAAPSSVPSAAVNSDDDSNDAEANQDIAANSDDYTNAAEASQGTNVQTFTGSLGGPLPLSSKPPAPKTSSALPPMVKRIHSSARPRRCRGVVRYSIKLARMPLIVERLRVVWDSVMSRRRGAMLPLVRRVGNWEEKEGGSGIGEEWWHCRRDDP